MNRYIELKNEMEKVRKEMIEQFKQEFGLEIYFVVEVKNDDKTEYARITRFDIDEEDGEVYAWIKYPDERKYMRPVLHRIKRKHFEDGTVRVLPEDEEWDGCVHLFEYVRWTGRTRKVFTLGGIDEVDIDVYRCKFCGEEVCE